MNQAERSLRLGLQEKLAACLIGNEREKGKAIKGCRVSRLCRRGRSTRRLTTNRIARPRRQIDEGMLQELVRQVPTSNRAWESESCRAKSPKPWSRPASPSTETGCLNWSGSTACWCGQRDARPAPPSTTTPTRVPQSGRRVRGACFAPDLGSRHHLHLDRGGLSLPPAGKRPLLAQDQSATTLPRPWRLGRARGRCSRLSSNCCRAASPCITATGSRVARSLGHRPPLRGWKQAKCAPGSQRLEPTHSQHPKTSNQTQQNRIATDLNFKLGRQIGLKLPRGTFLDVDDNPIEPV